MKDADVVLRFVDLCEAKLVAAYDDERISGWQVTPGKQTVKLFARSKGPGGYKKARFEITRREILIARHSGEDLADEVAGRLLEKLGEASAEQED